MRASSGEHIVVRSRHLGEPDREGEILQVRGVDGAPPYLVRWCEDGHEGLFFPESDAYVVHEHQHSAEPDAVPSQRDRRRLAAGAFQSRRSTRSLPGG